MITTTAAVNRMETPGRAEAPEGGGGIIIIIISSSSISIMSTMNIMSIVNHNNIYNTIIIVL